MKALNQFLVLLTCWLTVASVALADIALTNDVDNGSTRKNAAVGELIAGLEARLQANPDDGKGWLLAAKSYDYLGRPRDARAALARARALGVTDAALEKRLSAAKSNESDWDIPVSFEVLMSPEG